MAESKSFLEQVLCAESAGSAAESLSLSTAVAARGKDVIAASLRGLGWLVGNLLVIHRRLHE